MPDEHPTRVECTECPFSRIVRPDADEKPADVVTRHGRETGHTLSVSPVESDDD